LATREENLKKINDELEQLSDEDLDNVAGGTIGETAKDSEILYDYGLVKEWHTSLHMIFHWESGSAEVDDGWSKAGITCVTKPFSNNKYFKDGKQISRDEAMNIVKSKFKRIHHISDIKVFN